MAGVPKAGVNWREIELAWKGGASPSKLAKLHNVTRQAIENRRDRHGWERDEAAAALAATETGQRTIEPQTKADRRIIADGKRTLANMQMVLEVLAEGSSVRLAAQRIGMPESTLRAWMKADQDFARMAAAAEAEAGIRAVERVNAAGARGEWKADAWMLERMRATREDFAPVPAGVATVPGIPLLQLVFTDRGVAEALAARMTGDGPSAVFVKHSDGTQEQIRPGAGARPVIEPEREG
ncbi:hypothetical protein [Roseomonas marmotae]|uniref:Helix-turn-helix domain-containing protein n=1 Tax=Roseomonas marmotae TaxID=2768161 RepID=A0ABS3K9W6_9PROT|nr:hypothetical protein [Roseomonas marmotae]MBO1074247.1 hypothetical protein [Roseomonas marmotae]